MGIITTAVRFVFGGFAGLLRLGPFIVREFLSGGTKRIAAYEPVEELGASLVKQDKETKDEDFKDVYMDSKDGTRLHAVVDSGSQRVKGRRPIVFVHGFPELWISWLDQMKYFASKGHPVLSLDMRGYGLSGKPVGLEHYRIFEDIVEDIRVAVGFARKDAGEGSTPPLLAAHDWGASICWFYASQSRTTKTNEIAGYATLAIPPPECFQANLGLKQLWASLYMFFFNAPYLPEKVLLARDASMIALMMTATKQAVLPSWMVNAYRSNCLREGAMTAQLNYYRSVIQNGPKPDPADVLGPKQDGSPGRRLELPVLMIRGKDDNALTEDVFVGYDRYLDKARLVALDNCSHWIQADCPEQVNTELEKFLGEL